MPSYFAGTVQPTFPLRADLRPQRPSAPDFACGQLCKFDSNSAKDGAFLLLDAKRCFKFGSNALDGLLHANVGYVIIAAPLAEGLPATPHATVGANSHSAVSALSNSTIDTGHRYVAVACSVFDLAIGVHAALFNCANSANSLRMRS